MPIIRQATTRAPLARSALAMHEHRITQDAMGRKFRTIPGGAFAMGSRRYSNATPHMVQVNSFDAAITPEPEHLYRRIMGKPGNSRATGNKPVTIVSYRDAEAYFDRNNTQVGKADHTGFLTEAEYEMAARGGVVDVRQLAEEQKLRNSSQLAEWLKANGDPLENFVGALDLTLRSDDILDPDPKSHKFKALIEGAGNVYAWRRLPTLSGARTDELWIGQRDTADVSESERLNAAGLSDMSGNALSWVADVYRQDYEALDPQNPYNAPTPDSEFDNSGRVWRGGVFHYNDDSAAFRNVFHPVSQYIFLGLRVGRVPLPQDSIP